jgi:hypothetical protein
VTPVALGGLGTGMGAYQDDFTDPFGNPERAYSIIWQRGRVVFELQTFGTPDAAEAMLPRLGPMAWKVGATMAERPEPPDSFGPPPAWLPSESRMLALAEAAKDRLLPAEAFPGLQLSYYTVQATDVSQLMLAAIALDAVDPRLISERLLDKERLLFRVIQSFETPKDQSSPPGSIYPNVNMTYTLYADEDGAAASIAGPALEWGLRMRISNRDIKTTPPTTEVPTSLEVGEQSGMVRGSWDLEGQPMESTVMRWRHGAVVLGVQVDLAAGQDPMPLLNDAVAKLDATYAANPMPPS